MPANKKTNMKPQLADSTNSFRENGSMLRLVQPLKPVKKRGKLTKREIEVLQLVAQGMTAHDVASRLFLSLQTVETHKKNISRKLGAKNTLEAVVKAVRGRLI